MLVVHSEGQIFVSTHLSACLGPEQQGTSGVSAEVASRVGAGMRAPWTLVIAQNLPTAHHKYTA